jgi:hypothetical protein
MEYDAHITRSRDWANPTKRISAEEWSACLEARPGLSEWLHYDDGGELDLSCVAHGLDASDEE